MIEIFFHTWCQRLSIIIVLLMLNSYQQGHADNIRQQTTLNNILTLTLIAIVCMPILFQISGLQRNKFRVYFVHIL